MKNKKSATAPLKICLNLFWWLLLLLSISVSYYSFNNPTSAGSTNLLVQTILRFLIVAATLYVIYLLKKVVETVQSKTPFCFENIQRFRSISKFVFALGLIDTLINLNLAEGFRIISLPNFNIKASIFIYLIFGFLSLVFAEIFEKAAEIKNENDLTI